MHALHWIDDVWWAQFPIECILEFDTHRTVVGIGWVGSMLPCRYVCSTGSLWWSTLTNKNMECCSLATRIKATVNRFSLNVLFLDVPCAWAMARGICLQLGVVHLGETSSKFTSKCASKVCSVHLGNGKYILHTLSVSLKMTWGGVHILNTLIFVFPSLHFWGSNAPLRAS